MSKSLESYLRDISEGILTDALASFPDLAKGFKRDSTRLSLLARARGIGIYTLDLPEMGKHFDRCLANGKYSPSGCPLSRVVSKAVKVPRLFSGIHLLVFERSGMLKEHPDMKAITLLRQLYLFAKKVDLACSHSKTVKAVYEYFEVEHALPPPTLEWGSVDFGSDHANLTFDSYRPDPGPLFAGSSPSTKIQASQLALCQRVFDRIAIQLGSFDPNEWRFRHGPGAVADGSVGRFSKYEFPTWSARLERVFPMADFGFANFGCWADSAGLDTLPHGDDVAARLLAVPKTQKGPRLIAKEPTSNQWCQQALLNFFERRLATPLFALSITLRDQTGNQRAARSASEDGRSWTVDLSSASDRVSCRFVERALRGNLEVLRALNACRTPYLEQTLAKGAPRLIKLKKFSTMGSACTFPMESILFFGLAISAVLLARGLGPTEKNIFSVRRQVRVYGDDLIVPADSGEYLLELLRHFDFKVNPTKTFGDGLFRESCGLDAYAGVDVTPVYVRKLPQRCRPASIVSAVDTRNNFYFRGYTSVADRIRRRVPLGDIPTVGVGAGAFGYWSWYGPQVSKILVDRSYQRPYARGYLLVADKTRAVAETNATLLQFFTEGSHAAQGMPWTAGYEQRPRLTLRRGKVGLQEMGGTPTLVGPRGPLF